MSREGKAPAFLFYATDWLVDLPVTRLSLTQKGAYVDLLCYQWIEGGLADDKDELASILRVSRSKFDRIWIGIEKFFPLTPDGLRCNTRLESERVRMLGIREERRKSSEARWKRNANAYPNAYPNGHAFADQKQSIAIASTSTSSSFKAKTENPVRDPDLGWFAALWSERSGVLLPDATGMVLVLSLVRDYDAATKAGALKATAAALLGAYARLISGWDSPIWAPHLFVKHWEAIQGLAGKASSAKPGSAAADLMRKAAAARGDM